MKLAKLLTHAIELHGIYAMLYECTYTAQRKPVVYCKYNGELIGHVTYDDCKQPTYEELTDRDSTIYDSEDIV